MTVATIIGDVRSKVFATGKGPKIQRQTQDIVDTVVLNDTALEDFIQVDVSISETHSQDIEISEHPLETGSDISDHRHVKPIQIQMRGVMAGSATNPFDFLDNQKTSGQFTSDQDRMQEAYAKLQAMVTSDDLFTIATSLKIYTNMTLTRLSISRDSKSGLCVAFDATWQEFLFASSADAKVVLKAKKTVRLDKSTKKDTPVGTGDAGPNKSFLASVTDGIKEALGK